MLVTVRQVCCHAGATRNEKGKEFAHAALCTAKKAIEGRSSSELVQISHDDSSTVAHVSDGDVLYVLPGFMEDWACCTCATARQSILCHHHVLALSAMFNDVPPKDFEDKVLMLAGRQLGADGKCAWGKGGMAPLTQKLQELAELAQPMQVTGLMVPYVQVVHQEQQQDTPAIAHAKALLARLAASQNAAGAMPDVQPAAAMQTVQPGGAMQNVQPGDAMQNVQPAVHIMRAQQHSQPPPVPVTMPQPDPDHVCTTTCQLPALTPSKRSVQNACRAEEEDMQQILDMLQDPALSDTGRRALYAQVRRDLEGLKKLGERCLDEDSVPVVCGPFQSRDGHNHIPQYSPPRRLSASEAARVKKQQANKKPKKKPKKSLLAAEVALTFGVCEFNITDAMQAQRAKKKPHGFGDRSKLFQNHLDDKYGQKENVPDSNGRAN